MSGADDVRDDEDQPRVVWIVNHYAMFPGKDAREGRHYAMGRHLTTHGWTTAIIAAATTHPSGERRLPWWRLRAAGVERGVRYVWIGAPSYRANGISRIVNMAVFSILALLPGQLRSLPRPDVVIGSTVHPFAAWVGLRLARRHDASFIFEIRDVWPETLVDLGHWPADGTATRLLGRLMHRLVRDADLVLSPLPAIDEYVKEIGQPGKPTLWVANGADDEQWLPPPRAVREEPFTFMYLGSHGHANALDTLIDAFDLFARTHPERPARLQLVGDGPLKGRLMSHAAAKASGTSIEFHSRIPRSDVLRVAAGAHCLVAIVKDRPVYRFGISLNKMFDYMLAGRPILFASPVPRNPVAISGAGISLASEDAAVIGSAMAEMAGLSDEELDRRGANGRSHILENYTYGHLARRLATGLDGLRTGTRPGRAPHRRRLPNAGSTGPVS